MADIRIKDLTTTATTTAADDFLGVDGLTNGTRKLNAATPAFLTSVTVPLVTSAAGANLALSVGTAASGITALNGTTDATSSTAAAVTIAGGLAVAKKLNVGTDVAIGGNITTAVLATNTGSHVFGTTNTVTVAAGVITSNKGDAAALSVQPADANKGAFTQVINNGGTLSIGLDNSTAGLFGTAGNYGTAIYRPVTTSFAISRTSTVDFLIGPTGLITCASSLAVGGATVSASTGLITPAGTTSISSLRIPHGAAPTSPVDGDMWTTSAGGLFIRINGVTKTVTLT